MVPWRFVRLAIVDAVGRVHAHLTPPGLEDQPTRASPYRILDVGPAEDVAKECARCWGIVGIIRVWMLVIIRLKLLIAPRIVLFPSTATQGTIHHCQRKTEMSPSLQSRNVPFGLGLRRGMIFCDRR